ncbi:MAG: hypothetical protein IJD06_01375 [Clostridia bacterium]|nr:hypothetical protein [Clostridia bacterium]
MKTVRRIRWNPAVLLLLLPLVLTACHTGQYPPQYDIVYEAGYNPEPDRRDTTEVITELSTRIVVCTLREREVQKWDAANGFQSLYTAEIDEILMDVRGTLAAGEIIRFSSYEGLIPVHQASAAMETMPASASTQRSRELTALLRAAPEDSFVLSSGHDGIPLVVGNTYLVYLSDWGMEPYRKEMGSDIVLIEEPDDFFTESGLSHMYELRRGKVYRGRDTVPMEITEKQLKEQIRDHISRRTGIAHEIGVFPYLQQYVWASSET